MMPLIGLGVFAILPWSQALPIYLVITVLSLFLYWKILQAMRAPVAIGPESLIDGIAEVVSAHDSQPQIRYRSELWSAVCQDKSETQLLRSGEKVRIVDFEGMKLVVRKITESTERSSYG
ncbi:NfeD family protein [Candidatus Acetothermia bacterium]|nr:NfeD family protein [Candidatus Acetothermia bacterium]